MKKIFLWLVFFFIFLVIFILSYLSIIGYETNKFNSLLEKKITTNVPNTKIDLNKIKIKINFKNFSFFVTTLKPNIQYYNNNIKIRKIDVYVSLKSLLIGNPEINKINIVSEEIDINKIKSIVKYQKPSNFKKFFLNEVNKGKATLKLDLYLNQNKIENFEINGVVKNLFASSQNMNLKKTSFVYSIKKNSGEIDNIRGNLNGFQINSGKVEFDNSKVLSINGNIESDLNLDKISVEKIIKKKPLKDLENLFLRGKIKSLFEISFDNTLKIIDYKFKASGNIQKSDLKFKKPNEYLFVKNNIKRLGLEKTEFKVSFAKNEKKSIDLSGLYKINENSLQKFTFKNLYNSNSNLVSINGDFDDEIIIPLINFKIKNKIVNINTELEIKKDIINIKKFNLIENKNKINIKNLSLKSERLSKFDSISIKTFIGNKLNNEFEIQYGAKIKIEGSKYDASNLTKLLNQNNNSNFLRNLNKDVLLNIKEISTSASNILYNFNLIGKINKGKFDKIVSKGEFKDGKFLDISLRIDKTTDKKILEIYSDLPKPLLANYKFFDGISGGKILIFSTYDEKMSNTNLTIENFKVKDAPGLVKLLSLADFGGLVDAMSGEGLSFEKLEMSLDRNDQVLNLKELYAIGPSISILMDGYVDSKTDLVSLRGTMVPAKTLNKFLSKLPIVGDILIPKEIGEGLFGISFKMKGIPGNIKTTVNPIKTLTPRFIQKALKKSN